MYTPLHLPTQPSFTSPYSHSIQPAPFPYPSSNLGHLEPRIHTAARRSDWPAQRVGKATLTAFRLVRESLVRIMIKPFGHLDGFQQRMHKVSQAICSFCLMYNLFDSPQTLLRQRSKCSTRKRIIHLLPIRPLAIVEIAKHLGEQMLPVRAPIMHRRPPALLHTLT